MVSDPECRDLPFSANNIYQPGKDLSASMIPPQSQDPAPLRWPGLSVSNDDPRQLTPETYGVEKSFTELCSELGFHESTAVVLQLEGFETPSDLRFLAATRDYPANLAFIKRYRDRCVLETYLNSYVPMGNRNLYTGTTLAVNKIDGTGVSTSAFGTLQAGPSQTVVDQFGNVSVPPGITPVVSTRAFAALQVLVGISLLIEDIVAYAQLGPIIASLITRHGSGFWSAIMLFISFACVRQRGRTRCPIIASLIFSLICMINGVVLCWLFSYALSVVGFESFTVGHALLYAGMFISSIGHTVVCSVAVCCGPTYPVQTNVQYVVSPPSIQRQSYDEEDE